ncbi:uncharacterized protein LOC133119436 isoform X1 [Conger conger]|uniref:uncharacterized protein LOC133119436 isoform X1 n=1 Tax=Conger conger TaxID=82655 RepID=UPI002A5A6255|nr:uncharacterized protein LOC133119436 isoform X1 [Conger conger]
MPPLDAHCTENGAVTALDDGLPDFYTKRVLPDSQLSSLHQAQSFRRKKRRSMLSIFGFRRNRNSTISTPETVGGATACGEQCRTVTSPPNNSTTENIYIIQAAKDCGKAGPRREGAEGKEEEPKGEGQREARPMPGAGGGRSPQKEVQWYIPHVDPTLSEMKRSEPESEAANPSDAGRPLDEPEEAEPGPDDGQADGPRPQAEVQRSPRSPPDTQTPPSPLTDRQTEAPPAEEHHRSAPCELKPDPPPQSSKPSLAYMRQRHLQESLEASVEGEAAVEREKEEERGSKTEAHPPPVPEKPADLQPISSRSPTDTPTTVMSPKEATNERKIPPPVPPSLSKPVLGSLDMAVNQDAEGVKGSVPMKPQRNRKSHSCDIGFERDSSSNPERLSDRKPPMKKPRLPQNRNKSLDLPGTGDYGNSEPS